MPRGVPDFTVSLNLFPDPTRAVIVLAGDLDLEARPELSGVVDRLHDSVLAHVDVDLTAVSFAGSVLANFLVQIRQALGSDCVLSASHPTPVIRRVLHLTDMESIVEIDDETSAGRGQVLAEETEFPQGTRADRLITVLSDTDRIAAV